MKMLDMVWKRLQRRRGKALFVLLGLLVGVGAGVGFLSLTQALSLEIQHKMELYGANILVSPATEALSLSFGGMSMGAVSFEMKELQEKELSALSSIPNARNIAAVGPVLLGTLEDGGVRRILAGMDFGTLSALRPWWRITGDYPREGQVLLGAETARAAGLKPGDVWSVGSLGWKVSGILEPTGSQEDFMAFAPLSEVQSALGKQGKISMAEVAALCSGCPIEEMVAQISKALPNARVQAIKQVVEGRLQAIEQMGRVAAGLSGLVLLVGALVVLVTMMASVRDRASEIGVLRAIGFRKRHIAELILVEAGVLSCLAGISGCALGMLWAMAALPFFSEGHSHSAPTPLFHPELALGAVLFSTVLGLLASLYPALTASRLDPVEAIRSY